MTDKVIEFSRGELTTKRRDLFRRVIREVEIGSIVRVELCNGCFYRSGDGTVTDIRHIRSRKITELTGNLLRPYTSSTNLRIGYLGKSGHEPLPLASVDIPYRFIESVYLLDLATRRKI